jgi:TetR/AcrR family transcriptional repressor of nem operon
MRYSDTHKQETRQKVVKAAAAAVRAKGPDGVGVAEIMAEAGLTHGGFYAHFASKDEMIAAAIDQMFAEGKSRLLLAIGERPPAQALASYIDFYLSREHRDTRTAGCPVPFLAADLPRLSDAARARFAAGVARMRERLAEQLARLGREDAEADASSMLSELVGALSLARAEPDPAASDAILERSRAALTRRFALEA